MEGKIKKVVPAQHFGPYLSFTRACLYLECSPNTLRKWLHEADINIVEFMNRYRRSDLDAMADIIEKKRALEAKQALEALKSSKSQKMLG